MTSARYGTGGIGFDERTGLWYGRIELPPKADGSRDRRRVTSKDKNEMLRKLRELQQRVDDGEQLRTKHWTVRSWGEHYITHVAPEKSRQGYDNMLRYYVYPTLGKRDLRKLQPEDVDRLLLKLKTKHGLADGSRAKVRKVLSAMLTAAQYRHFVRENVAKLTTCPPQPKRKDALTVPEAEAVLAHVAATNDRLEALAVLALALGLRRGECLALRWSAVDMKAKTLEVVDAKTKAGLRTVPMPTLLYRALQAHAARQRVERMEAAVWGDPDLIFTTNVGTVISGRTALRWWGRMCKAAGIGPWIDREGVEHGRRFHATRHTAATVMLNHDTDLEVISKILGHSGLAITADTYTQIEPELLRSGADTIDRVFGGS